MCVLAQNGVLLRTVLDTVTGDLSDTRTRYIGTRPVKLFRITMQGSEAVRVKLLYVTMQGSEAVMVKLLYITMQGS